MTRMSCRAPFAQLINVALRQSLPKIAGQNISAQLDIFNFANLVNTKWGNQPVVVQSGLPAVGILSRTAVATQNGKTVGVDTFDTGTRYQVSGRAQRGVELPHAAVAPVLVLRTTSPR